MSRFGFLLALILVFTVPAFTQHSSGGGGSSGGGSSSGGGGGSHGGSGGGGSSGGGHSSGGSGGGSSHGASSHGASSHGSSSHASSGGSSASHSNLRSGHELRGGQEGKSAQPEHRGFFAFLRHPFRKPEPRPVVDLRHRVCPGGLCKPCPVGEVSNGRGGCTSAYVASNRLFCSALSPLNAANACPVQTSFRGDCSAELMAIQQQAQRVRTAEMNRNAACSADPAQECSSLTTVFESESRLYRVMEDRYAQCRQRMFDSYIRGRYGFGNSSQDLRFDSFWID